VKISQGRKFLVLDYMVREYGPTRAIVYAYIERESSTPVSDWACCVSEETMAAGCGISKRSLDAHLQALIDDGYIVAVLKRRHAPCIYKPTHNADVMNRKAIYKDGD